MIYSELPKRNSRHKTSKGKFVSVISPERLLLNEKALFGLMLTGVAMALLSLLTRKEK